MKGKITVTGANIVFFTFIMGYLFFQMILSVLAAFYGISFINNNIYKISLINEYIIILVPTLLYAIIYRLNFRHVFRINKLKPVPLLLIVAMAIPTYFAAASFNNIIVFLLQFIGDVPAKQIPVPKNLGGLLQGLFTVALTPAICEEMLHRGILLKAYEKRGTLRAVIITSIFFGFFHFDITNLIGPIFIGLVIGYYVIRTNSIFAGMLAHFLNNAIAEIILFFAGDDIISESAAKIRPQDLAVVILCGIAGLALLKYLLKIFKKHTEDTAILTPPISSPKHDAISVLSHWPVISALVIYFIVVLVFVLSLAFAK